MNIVKPIRRALLSAVLLGSLFVLPQAALAKSVTVVIDPGHGGHDSGAVGNGIQEKDTNLAISREVAKEAKRQGWSVKMTRNSDKFIQLKSRAGVANRTPNSVLVSMHSNSTGKKSLGNMTIYRNAQSKKLGKSIMKYLGPQTDYKDIGNKSDVRGLAVLRNSKRPAVIVENLSVSSKKEAKRLKQPEEQEKMARAVVHGIADYKGVKYKPHPDEIKAAEEAKAEKKAAAEAKAADKAAKSATVPQHQRSAESLASATPLTVSVPAAKNAIPGQMVGDAVSTESDVLEEFDALK